VQHHGVVIERVGWTEQHAAMLEPAVGHRLDHHVHVAGVVEVAMADHYRVDRRQVDLALRILNDGAWTGIEADPRVPILDEQAA
jgi:hypothetical protein